MSLEAVSNGRILGECELGYQIGELDDGRVRIVDWFGVEWIADGRFEAFEMLTEHYSITDWEVER